MANKARVDLVLDCADPMRLSEFWRDALGYRVHFAAEGAVVLVPSEGISPPLVLQQVPEPKVGKNRMHLDITTDAVEPEVERLEKLGAARAHEGVRSMAGTRWVTMTDPDGNEFCIAAG